MLELLEVDVALDEVAVDAGQDEELGRRVVVRQIREALELDRAVERMAQAWELVELADHERLEELVPGRPVAVVVDLDDDAGVQFARPARAS